MAITANQIKRIQDDYEHIAKELVKAEIIGGSTLVVFGSELACLRIHYKLGTGRVEYSENLRSWVYTREINIK